MSALAGDAARVPAWLRLECPRCSAALTCGGGECRCETGHRWPVVGGIPHLLAHAPPDPSYVRWIADYYRVPFSLRQRELTRARFTRFLELAAPEPPVLDVGCGRAEKAAAFPPGSYVGIDQIDPVVSGMVDRVDAPIVVARAERLPLAAGQFGSVILWAVLDHVEDRGALLTECERVLRPGGRLCIMTQVIARRGGPGDLIGWALSRVRSGDVRGLLAVARFTYASPRGRAYLHPLTVERIVEEVSRRFGEVRTELLDGHALLLRATR